VHNFDVWVYTVVGDSRVNEQSVLAVLHTLWVREHNRIESILHRVNPHWLGQQLYQETRRIVSALVQHITYAEFLPAVLGTEVVDKYDLRLVDQGYYDGELYTLMSTVKTSSLTSSVESLGQDDSEERCSSLSVSHACPGVTNIFVGGCCLGVA